MFGHQDDEQTLNDQAAATTQHDQPTDWNDENKQADDVNQPAANPDDKDTDTVLGSDSTSTTVTARPTDEASDSDDLLAIKQQALSQLSPIVNHLDQTPEERFRTTMMMIQASDNQSLIKDAYEAAQQISDEKQKAQALLDIVNEINYFTHPQQH